jgi:type IV secretion system protein VirB4
MPNLKAHYDSYKAFGLTDAEFTTIKTLGENSRCFLIKHGSHSVIARLDLSGLDDLLAVLSGTEENVNHLTKIRSEYGDDPHIWLPIFLKTIKEKKS